MAARPIAERPGGTGRVGSRCVSTPHRDPHVGVRLRGAARKHTGCASHPAHRPENGLYGAHRSTHLPGPGRPKGRDLGVCACPPSAQENYISNKSPGRELSDGTKFFCAPGGERGFFHKSSSLVKYAAVLSIFRTQWPINGPSTPRSRPRASATCMLNKSSRNLAQNTPGLGFGMC